MELTNYSKWQAVVRAAELERERGRHDDKVSHNKARSVAMQTKRELAEAQIMKNAVENGTQVVNPLFKYHIMKYYNIFKKYILMVFLHLDL